MLATPKTDAKLIEILEFGMFDRFLESERCYYIYTNLAVKDLKELKVKLNSNKHEHRAFGPNKFVLCAITNSIFIHS